MTTTPDIVQRDRDNATALAKAIVASAGTPIYNSCDAGALRIQIAAAILDSVTAARAESASEIERLRTRAAAWEAEARAWKEAERQGLVTNPFATGNGNTASYYAWNRLVDARAHTDAVMKAQENKP